MSEEYEYEYQESKNWTIPEFGVRKDINLVLNKVNLGTFGTDR